MQTVFDQRSSSHISSLDSPSEILLAKTRDMDGTWPLDASTCIFITTSPIIHILVLLHHHYPCTGKLHVYAIHLHLFHASEMNPALKIAVGEPSSRAVAASWRFSAATTCILILNGTLAYPEWLLTWIIIPKSACICDSSTSFVSLNLPERLRDDGHHIDLLDKDKNNHQ